MGIKTGMGGKAAMRKKGLDFGKRTLGMIHGGYEYGFGKTQK
jgi:hypothetical protein